MMRRTLALLTLLVSASLARADTIQIASVPDPYQKGSFTGSIGYDASHAVLTISLTNTTAASLSGYITAFVFDINGPQDASLTGASINGTTTTKFHGFNNVSASPLGTFEEGVSLGSNTGSNFADGGSPTKGIAAGQTGTFSFKLTGTGANTLTAESFLNQPVGPFELPLFAVRYRGFADGSSSKLLAYAVCNPGDDEPGPPGPVPLPAAAPAGFALLGTLALKRRLRSRQLRND